MHTHINYKGACVIEVEQKCYSFISREQEAKYVERHKSNVDTLIFNFMLSTKEPILDAVNMRRRNRRNRRVQPGPLQYASRLIQALKRWPRKGCNYLKLKRVGRCAAEQPLTPLNSKGNWTPVPEKAQEPRARRSYMVRPHIFEKGWNWNCAVGFKFAWQKYHRFCVRLTEISSFLRSENSCMFQICLLTRLNASVIWNEYDYSHLWLLS